MQWKPFQNIPGCVKPCPLLHSLAEIFCHLPTQIKTLFQIKPNMKQRALGLVQFLHSISNTKF